MASISGPGSSSSLSVSALALASELRRSRVDGYDLSFLFNSGGLFLSTDSAGLSGGNFSSFYLDSHFAVSRTATMGATSPTGASFGFVFVHQVFSSVFGFAQAHCAVDFGEAAHAQSQKAYGDDTQAEEIPHAPHLFGLSFDNVVSVFFLFDAFF